MAAQGTAVGQEDPAQSLFPGVADAYASKLHGPAMGTLWREHRWSLDGASHPKVSRYGWGARQAAPRPSGDGRRGGLRR
jgi:hypothetical protein